jgi:hypothetical protein
MKEKRDPYKHKKRWLEWKEEAQEKGIKGISKTNSDTILAYLNDMELGLNLGKGCPKYHLKIDLKAENLNELYLENYGNLFDNLFNNEKNYPSPETLK